MSDNSLQKRGKALENEYFTRKNNEALERLKKKKAETKQPVSPIDGSALESFVINGVVVAKCKTSEGLWISQDELKQLISQCDEEPDAALAAQFIDDLNSDVAKSAGQSVGANEEVRKSPVTGTDMEKISIAGQLVDRCTDTGGIWLDAGELEGLLAREKEEKSSKDSFLGEFFRGLLG